MIDRISEQRDGLLKFVDELKSDIVMVEIGCFAGGSTEIFLNSGKIKKLYCVDPWSNGFNDQDPEHSNNAEYAETIFDSRITTKFDNVVKLKMKSDSCASSITEKVDVVYVDGDHTYEACLNDIKIAKSILKEDGVICGHDCNMPSVVKAIIDSKLKIKKAFADFSWISENA